MKPDVGNKKIPWTKLNKRIHGILHVYNSDIYLIDLTFDVGIEEFEGVLHGGYKIGTDIMIIAFINVIFVVLTGFLHLACQYF